jgi:hypothetical protein
MKKIIITFLLLPLVLTDSVNAQETLVDSSFHKIIVSSGILVQIIRSEQYSVEIKNKEVEDKCLNNTLENGILSLKLVSGFKCKGKVVVSINCPTLEEIEIMGKADVSTGNILTGDSLLVRMKSGGKAYIDLDIKYLDVKLSEGAMARFEGYANEQAIEVSTSATYSGWELEGQSIKVSAASNSIAKVNAQQEIQAIAGSGGYISIKGNPQKKTIDSKSNGRIEVLTD